MSEESSILIVDDEPSIFEVLEGMLFNQGYDLNYVSNGVQALDRVAIYPPDLILLDLMMPEIDGLEVCRCIKSNPQWQHIPIIMITALNSKEDLAQCLDAGADDFVGKPISRIELSARIRSMLRIKQQYDILQSALQLREDMSDTIVRDLRNPLYNITLAAESLQLADLDEKQLKRVTNITNASQRLLSLVDDILIIGSEESGKLQLNFTSIDLHDMLSQVLSDFETIAASKRIQLVACLPERGKHIALDANLMRRVFDNLFANAIKFSPSGSQIDLSIDYPTEPGIQAKIYIADRGEGVKDESKLSIFEKYEIGDSMSGAPQMGLGLAFCKTVVNAHGGRIYVTDRHPEGSIFTIELPT